MTSFDRLHIGSTIGLSFISINRFLSVNSLIISVLASNLFIPCSGKTHSANNSTIFEDAYDSNIKNRFVIHLKKYIYNTVNFP